MPLKILLIQLRQLGDIILTTPCIREIKRSQGEHHISFLSHRMGKQILEANPSLDELLLYDDQGGFKSELELVRTIKKKKFDLVIDFMNNPRSGFYTFATRAPHRLSFRSSRSFFYTDTITRSKGESYIVNEKFGLLEHAGFSPKNIALDLPWFENHAATTMKFIHQSPDFRDAGLRVVLSPTHRRPQRRWDIEDFSKLSDRLSGEWGAVVSWLWGPGEESLIDEAMKLCKIKTHKAPPTSFREMCAFIANHDLFVGNSNGPSHVAVSTDICSLQLHGHTSARSWCPQTKKHQAIQSSQRRSHPEQAMSAIALDDVWAGLLAMKPAIDEQSQRRRQIGVRLHWQLR